MIDDLREIAETKRKLFRNHQDEMVASYKRELETTEGYNGRQLLELIQNCDDEGADKVQISIDEEEQTLSIANTGKPFSLKGYRSIVTSNLSPKNDKKRFIGNKGLGFRSVVYWADKIQIQSNGIVLAFSHKTAKKEYEKLFDLTQRREIEREYDLKKGTVPVSMLAIPEIRQTKELSEFSTRITIKYKEEFLDDIYTQVEQLRPEILLFLHNIEQINFIGFDNTETLTCHKKSLPRENEFGPSEVVQVNDRDWQIFTKEGKINGLENKGEDSGFYQIKLAVSKSMGTGYPFLFSYFPTKIKLDFPYLIHGTFDLDQNRNSLNKTVRNKLVLKEMVSLIVDTANYYSAQEIGWRPFKMLHFDEERNNERLNDLGFYESLKRAIINEPIWPCVDGRYRGLKDIIHIEDDFSDFILDNGFSGNFPNLLIPKDDTKAGKYFKEPNISNIEEVVDKVSRKINQQDVRAKLIYLSNKYFPKKQFSFITDRAGEIIDKSDDVFTPSSSDIDVPNYFKIHFIDEDLYEYLIQEFNLENATHKARELQRKLKSNCNIFSYEPQYLIQKIISQANKIISSNRDTPYKKQVIIEMVQTLYQMYQDMPEPPSLRIENIPLLNINGDIVQSKELFLNDDFESGKKAKAIFKNTRSTGQILAYPSAFGLKKESSETIDEFFTWLGVNTFVRVEIKKNTEKLKGDEYGYRKFVMKKLGVAPKNFLSLSYTRIHDLDNIISNLSIEELLCWFCLDHMIQKQLITDEDHSKLTYSYYGTKYKHHLPSYLHYKLKQRGNNFEYHLVESKYSWANDIEIDFNHELFKELNIESFEIERILKLLGGKSSFSDLSISRVTSIINSLPDKFPLGKNSQTTYKDAVKHFEQNQQIPSIPLRLFAKTNNGLEVFSQEEIYFSDKIKLPANQQDRFPTLNFPLRSGGKKAIEFFGINDLEDVEVKVVDYQLMSSLNEDFNSYLNNLKPYLFLYRLHEIESTNQKEREAEYLRKLNISICDDIIFEINGERQRVQKYGYVSGENYNYYVKCKSLDSVSDLRKNAKFSDSFSNILAELFDVANHKLEHRSLFKNGLEDADHITNQEFGSELIEESRIRLGMGNNYSAFWSAIYECLNKAYKGQNVKDDLELETDIRDLNYEDLSSDENIRALSHLFDQLDISLGAFNSNSPISIDLTSKHISRLKNEIFNLFNPFKIKCWERLKSSPISEKKTLLQLWFEFEECEVEVENFANNNRERFEPDYNAFLNEHLSKFALNIQDLTDTNYNGLDLDSKFKSSLTEFDEKEREEILKNQELKSLLYFEEGIDYLNNLLKEKSSQNEHSQKTGSFESESESGQKGKIKTIRGKTLFPGKKNNTSERKQPYQPNRNSAEKKKTGDRCEERVKRELEKNYGVNFVDHVSKRDEGKHYDIRYSPDKGVNWKYAEVKNYAKGRFVLTQAEKEFGKEHSKDYEFHLVDLNNDVIYIIEDPYNTSRLDFEGKEYWVYYHLQ